MIDNDTQALFEHGDLTVLVTMASDPDSSPADQDFENEADRTDFIARFNRGDFVYVGMIARVLWDHRNIGTYSVWNIEHGEVGAGTVADAWDMTPPEYTSPENVCMGSPLNGVVLEALSEAEKFLASVGASEGPEGPRGALGAARQWADPNHPDLATGGTR